MTKASFLGELRLRLASLPDADIQEALEYYEEMIDDRIEAGMDEEEAVRTLGTPRAAADSMSYETSYHMISSVFGMGLHCVADIVEGRARL